MNIILRFLAPTICALLILSGCVQMPGQHGPGQEQRAVVTATATDVPLAYAPAELIEGKDNRLGLDTVKDHVTFHFSYPDMEVGHTVKLYWNGKRQYSTPILTVQSFGTLAFRVPRAEVANDVGGTAVVTVSVQKPGVPLERSDPLTVHIQASLPFEVPRPVLQGQAANGEYPLGSGDAKVIVAYPTMKVGDTVGLRWKGRTTVNLPIQRVSAIGPLTFTIKHADVARDLGSAVVLTASVGGDGNPLRISQASSVTVVDRNGAIKAPVIEEANGEWLNLNDIDGQATITVDDPVIVAGSTVQVWIAGATTHKTPIQTAAGPGPVIVRVNRAVFEPDKGSTVQVTASVGGNGNPIVVSPPVPLTISQPTGAEVLAGIKARYNVTGACAGKPAFNCNGVLLRSVDNGTFNPWDPSPNQLMIGGTSFSYMRKDATVRDTYRLAGFVFSTLDEARKLQKPVTPLCIYPFDAATGSDQAATKGCGSRGHAGSGPGDLSTCKTANAITLATWQAFTRTISSAKGQCSLSVGDVAQFELTQEARRNPTPNLNNNWNELMIETWPTGQGRKLPIEAFFYKAGNAQSLANAKVFQQKLRTVTHRWVPIISINFANQADPYSYSAGDQGIQP